AAMALSTRARARPATRRDRRWPAPPPRTPPARQWAPGAHRRASRAGRSPRTPPSAGGGAPSELHLHPELYLPRGAYGGRDRARVGRRLSRRIEHRGRRQPEVRMVEDVERLAPELQLHPAHREVLEDAGVPARVAGADQRVPAEVAEEAGLGQQERRGI